MCPRHSPECSGSQTRSLPMAGGGGGGWGRGKQTALLACKGTMMDVSTGPPCRSMEVSGSTLPRGDKGKATSELQFKGQASIIQMSRGSYLKQKQEYRRSTETRGSLGTLSSSVC